MSRPFTEQLTEGQALAGVTITTLNNSSVLTSALDMSLVRRARLLLNCGTLTGGASINVKAQASATEGGSYTDIDTPTTDPAITGITTDDSFHTIEIRADQMPTGKPWLKFYIVETATANAVVAAFVVGDCGSYGPNNDNNTLTLTNAIVAA